MDVEKVIFNLYKDTVIVSSVFKNEVMKKFNISLRQASDLFARITNYQIKRYGRKLNDFYDIPTEEESETINRRAKQREYRRTRG